MTARKVVKLSTLFCVGGGLYTAIELLWRGYSHISMFFLGGVCFIAIGAINELFPWSLGFVWQSLIGAALVTALELVSGIILNLWLGLGVWDYSTMPCNLWGQICLPYSMAWVALSAVAIVIDDWLRHILFDEEKPHYKII